MKQQERKRIVSFHYDNKLRNLAIIKGLVFFIVIAIIASRMQGGEITDKAIFASILFFLVLLIVERLYKEYGEFKVDITINDDILTIYYQVAKKTATIRKEDIIEIKREAYSKRSFFARDGVTIYTRRGNYTFFWIYMKEWQQVEGAINNFYRIS